MTMHFIVLSASSNKMHFIVLSAPSDKRHFIVLSAPSDKRHFIVLSAPSNKRIPDTASSYLFRISPNFVSKLSPVTRLFLHYRLIRPAMHYPVYRTGAPQQSCRTGIPDSVWPKKLTCLVAFRHGTAYEY